MGAWGTGPFDSDGTLDWLGELAERHARLDDDGQIVPGTVDVAAVTADVRVALHAALAPPPPGPNPRPDLISDTEHAGMHLRYTVAEPAYAAAGLVAAVLSGQPDGLPTSTRLLEHLDAAAAGVHHEDGDPLRLSAHCGYAALLDRPAADTLRGDARAAVEVLPGLDAWLQGYPEQLRVLEQLDRLRTVLTAPGA